MVFVTILLLLICRGLKMNLTILPGATDSSFLREVGVYVSVLKHYNGTARVECSDDV